MSWRSRAVGDISSSWTSASLEGGTAVAGRDLPMPIISRFLRCPLETVPGRLKANSQGSSHKHCCSSHACYRTSDMVSISAQPESAPGTFKQVVFNRWLTLTGLILGEARQGAPTTYTYNIQQHVMLSSWGYKILPHWCSWLTGEDLIFSSVHWSNKRGWNMYTRVENSITYLQSTYNYGLFSGS